jgi:hypothetical protein
MTLSCICPKGHPYNQYDISTEDYKDYPKCPVCLRHALLVEDKPIPDWVNRDADDSLTTIKRREESKKN